MNFQGLFIFIKISSNIKYERILLFSKKFIYKLASSNIISLGWVIAIDSIHSIRINKKNPKEIGILVNSSTNKKLVNENKYPFKSKDEYKFELKYGQNTNEIVFLLRKSLSLNNTALKVIY